MAEVVLWSNIATALAHWGGCKDNQDKLKWEGRNSSGSAGRCWTSSGPICVARQSDIEDRYRKGLISHEQWAKETEENDRRKAYFWEQLDIFWEKAERMKKY